MEDPKSEENAATHVEEIKCWEDVYSKLETLQHRIDLSTEEKNESIQSILKITLYDFKSLRGGILHYDWLQKFIILQEDHNGDYNDLVQFVLAGIYLSHLDLGDDALKSAAAYLQKSSPVNLTNHCCDFLNLVDTWEAVKTLHLHSDNEKITKSVEIIHNLVRIDYGFEMHTDILEHYSIHFNEKDFYWSLSW